MSSGTHSSPRKAYSSGLFATSKGDSNPASASLATTDSTTVGPSSLSRSRALFAPMRLLSPPARIAAPTPLLIFVSLVPLLFNRVVARVDALSHAFYNAERNDSMKRLDDLLQETSALH